MTGLAEISEIEAASAIENDVVRSVQFVVAATVVKKARLAGLRIDPFDASAGIVCGLADSDEAARV